MDYSTYSDEELADYIFNGYQGALSKAIPARNSFEKTDNIFFIILSVVIYKRLFRYRTNRVTAIPVVIPTVIASVVFH